MGVAVRHEKRGWAAPLWAMREGDHHGADGEDVEVKKEYCLAGRFV